MSATGSGKGKSGQEAQRGFGMLPPRYRFILNPYRDQRFTSCPDCGKLTRWRKFVLLVHVDPMILLAQNIHYRTCPDCDLLIVHQDELETQLAIHISERFPSAVGNDSWCSARWSALPGAKTGATPSRYLRRWNTWLTSGKCSRSR